MSDRPKWMPSDEEINAACNEDDSPDYQPGEASFVTTVPLVRSLVRAAVEKALAAQEARHKREVILAKIALIDKWALCICPFTGGSRCNGSDGECPGCRDLNEARAELAALSQEELKA